MGKPSCALAWGLVLAVTIALGCSDHAVPTMPELASVDPATTSTPRPLDLSDDSSIATDTAKVAPGMVGGLVGTTVLDEKIVKDGHSVGVLVGRPEGPTGSTGGVDAERTQAQPTEPEAEVAPKPVSGGVMSDGWCLVSIWYNIHTGEIVAAEVLYCWNGNGEGNGGGGNNNQPSGSTSRSPAPLRLRGGATDDVPSARSARTVRSIPTPSPSRGPHPPARPHPVRV